MTQKIDKLARDIAKTRARIAEDKERLAAMEKQKTELEDIEVVKMYRVSEIDPRDVAAFIRSIRENESRRPPVYPTATSSDTIGLEDIERSRREECEDEGEYGPDD